MSAWTARVAYKGPLGDRVEVVVDLTNGTIKSQGRYATDGTVANLLPQVRQTTAQLDTQAVKSDIQVGQLLDLTPPVVDPPVDPNPKLTAFRQLYFSYQRALPLVALGLPLDKSAPTADDVSAAWDPSFTGLV